MTPLPIQSCATVARIEALIDEAELLGTFGDQELSYAFRQTQRRYLPGTINAHLKISESHRDAAAQKMLLDQLLIIERSTRERLAFFADARRTKEATRGGLLISASVQNRD